MRARLAFALGFVGALFLIVAAEEACSSTSAGEGAPDANGSCPVTLPHAGDACGTAGMECGYATSTNACGADNCYCQGGTWNCEPTCVIDAGPTCTDANSQLIQASSYDQSCKVDSDCVAVGEGNACYACQIACPNAAINASAKARYLADIPKTAATGQFCGCPAAFNPCCRAGICHADLQCQSPGPDMDAAADTGADACAPPIVCSGACVSGAHNVTSMVDGCLVTRCCVPDDAGADAATDAVAE